MRLHFTVGTAAPVREIPYGPEGQVGGSRSRVARYCVCIEYNESQRPEFAETGRGGTETGEGGTETGEKVA